MKSTTASMLIARPVPQVFDYFVQKLRDGAVEGDVAALAHMTPESIRAWNTTKIEGERVWFEFDVDRSISTHPKDDRNGSLRGIWRFEELPSGCRVELECFVEPGGIWKLPVLSLIWLVAMPELGRSIREDLESAKAELEYVDEDSIAVSSSQPEQ